MTRESYRSASGIVRAAGGVVWRVDDRAGSLSLEVMAVHRPGHDDWSLPKGKLHRHETIVDCALREVREETGLRCSPQIELTPTHYIMTDGIEKVIQWWSMVVVDDLGFAASSEVDERMWVRVDEFAELATYGSDVQVVDEFVASWP